MLSRNQEEKSKISHGERRFQMFVNKQLKNVDTNTVTIIKLKNVKSGERLEIAEDFQRCESRSYAERIRTLITRWFVICQWQIIEFSENFRFD